MTISEIAKSMKRLRTANDFAQMESLIRMHPEFLVAPNGAPFDLTIAARSGDLEYVQWLVQHGVDINSRSTGKQTPPVNSAANLGQTEVVRWMVENGATINFTIDDKPPFCPPLATAIRDGNNEMARILIDAGALLNVHDRYMMTPLSWAMRFGRTELADYIRARGGKMPNEIPGWVEPKTKGPLVQRVEQIIGPCHPNSWQAILPDDVPVAIRIATDPRNERVGLFTQGMSERAMTVPEGKHDFRYAELFLVISEWPTDPASWNTPEWNWPINWLRELAQRPFRDNGWLGEPVSIVATGAPLGPNTAMTGWLLVSDYPPFNRLQIGDKLVMGYTLLAVHTAEIDYAMANGVPALLKRFAAEDLAIDMYRDRESVV